MDQELKKVGIEVNVDWKHLEQYSRNRQLWKKLRIQIEETHRWIRHANLQQLNKKKDVLSYLRVSPQQLTQDLARSLPVSPEPDSPLISRIFLTVEYCQLDRETRKLARTLSA